MARLEDKNKLLQAENELLKKLPPVKYRHQLQQVA